MAPHEEEDAWQPAMTGSFPLVLRIGAVGAGIGVGCGVGIGFGGPLGAIPALSSATSGISAGLASVGGMLGGWPAAARARVRGLGVRGLDVGMGCGVGVGYGFGAGLMLRPSAWEQLCLGASQAAGSVTHAVSSHLTAAGLMPPAAAAAGTGQPLGRPEPLAGLPTPGMADPVAASSLQQAMSGAYGALLQPQQQATPIQQQQQQGLQADADVLRTLLRQQQQIDELRNQNRALRRAVCKLDVSAPFCPAGGAGSEEHGW